LIAKLVYIAPNKSCHPKAIVCSAQGGSAVPERRICCGFGRMLFYGHIEDLITRLIKKCARNHMFGRVTCSEFS